MFMGRSDTEAESRYHANELEALALVGSVRLILHGRRFSVKTDSSALRWVMSKKDVTGKFGGY